MKRIQAFEHGTAYKAVPQLPFHAACNPMINVVTPATREHERATYDHHYSAAVHCFPVWSGGWRSLVRSETFWTQNHYIDERAKAVAA